MVLPCTIVPFSLTAESLPMRPLSNDLLVFLGADVVKRQSECRLICPFISVRSLTHLPVLA
jgi:hypothetical protein